MRIIRRGYHLNPLLIIGKCILWFTSGISFGVAYFCASNVYYLGWLIISVKTRYHKDFIERVNNGTWPEDKVWIVKYKKI